VRGLFYDQVNDPFGLGVVDDGDIPHGVAGNLN
jgi:hypothetical protein